MHHNTSNNTKKCTRITVIMMKIQKCRTRHPAKGSGAGERVTGFIGTKGNPLPEDDGNPVFPAWINGYDDIGITIIRTERGIWRTET